MSVVRSEDTLLKRTKGISTRDLIPAGRSLTKEDKEKFLKKFKGEKIEREERQKDIEKQKKLQEVKTVEDVIEKPKHDEQIVNENSIKELVKGVNNDRENMKKLGIHSKTTLKELQDIAEEKGIDVKDKTKQELKDEIGG